MLRETPLDDFINALVFGRQVRNWSKNEAESVASQIEHEYGIRVIYEEVADGFEFHISHYHFREAPQ